MRTRNFISVIVLAVIFSSAMCEKEVEIQEQDLKPIERVTVSGKDDPNRPRGNSGSSSSSEESSDPGTTPEDGGGTVTPAPDEEFEISSIVGYWTVNFDDMEISIQITDGGKMTMATGMEGAPIADIEEIENGFKAELLAENDGVVGGYVFEFTNVQKTEDDSFSANVTMSLKMGEEIQEPTIDNQNLTFTRFNPEEEE